MLFWGKAAVVYQVNAEAFIDDRAEVVSTQ
jgi:hypothetical protein